MKNTTAIVGKEIESPLGVLCQTRPWVRGLLLASLFGALTALSAQVSIRLPGKLVPLTGQVFLVLLAGGLLGRKYGAVSQLEYLGFGALGLPVFAAASGGLPAFISPSGGYLFGFVAAAWVVGRLIGDGAKWWRIFLANLGGLCVIYLFGWLGLACWLGIHQPGGSALYRAFLLGVAPFVLVDLAKAFLATQVIHSLRSWSRHSAGPA